MAQFSVFDIVRPFMWIGVFAFVLGFAGYLFIGAGQQALYAQDALGTVQASAPAAPPPLDLRAV
ncbi:hypothetical protein [Phenylobacterium sp.]|uniref:hypothetical protein n=1 Tax=Phenylobacterium sp. TaxID=1871053 RepID=UPI00272F7F91|nr:hypothetical protein [Phenylobacterium sp.]MDP1601328.1 hypothetical protein [Phenylobacterium sp.]MDP3591323.1 hypothetical protein [Phenylobacterium sp.]